MSIFPACTREHILVVLVTESDSSNTLPPLEIDERGLGPAVVLLHGMPSDPRDFSYLADALATKRRVLVPRMPGYAGAPPDASPATMEDLVVRLEDRLLELAGC